MALKPDYPIQIFYDGACRICRSQVLKYKGRDTHDRLKLVDISRRDFNAKDYTLQNADLENYMYAKDSRGRTVRGAQAIAWMLRAVGHRILASLLTMPILKHLARIGYRGLAAHRYKIAGNVEPGKNVCTHCGTGHDRTDDAQDT